MSAARDLSFKRKHLRAENRLYTKRPVLIPPDEWKHIPGNNVGRIEVWRSCDYIIQVFQPPVETARSGTNYPFAQISVARAALRSDGHFEDGIPWEELQRIKNEIGYGAYDAVEIYPKDGDVINVANFRHLWILTYPLEFAWRSK